MNELKPCPFCGSRNIMTNHDYFGDRDWRGSYTVYCDCCSVDIGWRDTEEEAINFWNKRAPVENYGEIEDEKEEE